MALLSLPKELRLQIFSELLIVPAPIVFGVNWDSPSGRPRPLIRYYQAGLCPAILQLNRQTHSEASPLLYARNRFQFSDCITSYEIDSAEIAPFFAQIGSQASLIRHICIALPGWNYDQSGELSLQYHTRSLQAIRDTCTGIKTFQVSISADGHGADEVLGDSPKAAEALDLIDVHFMGILSPGDIIVNIQVDSEEGLDNAQMKKIRDRGWTAEVTKLPDETCFYGHWD
jgi:hypothetical protein